MRARFPVAAHIFLLKADTVLLLRRANTGYEDGNFGVVAGHVELGEPVSQAALREIKEEVGVIVHPADLQPVGVMHRLSDEERIDFFLVARRWIGEPVNAEPEKCSEIYWCPLHALPESTIPYVRQALLNFQAGLWYAEFGW